MRALILYHLVQAQAAERHRQAQRDAPARAASRARPPPAHHGAGTAPAGSPPWRRRQMTGRLTAHTYPAPAAACRPDRPRSSAGRDAAVLGRGHGGGPRGPRHRPAGRGRRLRGEAPGTCAGPVPARPGR